MDQTAIKDALKRFELYLLKQLILITSSFLILGQMPRELFAQTTPPPTGSAPAPTPTSATSTAPPAATTTPNPNAINNPRTSFPFLTTPSGAPLPMPQNIQRPNQTATPGKYAEYQSNCRSNLYDEDNWLLRSLNKDSELNEYIKLIKSNQISAAEKKALENREILGEIRFATINSILLSHRNAFSMANAILDSVPEKDRKLDPILLAASYVFEMQSNYQEAKLLIQDIYKKTKDPALLEDLCRMNSLDSHHRDADLSCTLAENKNPTNELIPIWHGISFRERENLVGAEAHFKKALERKKTEFGYVCLAEVFDLRGLLTDSIGAYRNALEIFPKSIRANLGLARLYFQQRKFEEALTYFVKSCEAGLKDKLQFRKSQKELTEQKNPIAEKYFQALQKCPN